MTVTWRGDAVWSKIRSAAEDALNTSAELVSKTWQDTIPYSSGELASHVQPQKSGRLEYTISGTGPYARRQEFDESLRHPNPDDPKSRSGRKAHAGRDALETNKDEIVKLITAKVNAALR